MTTRIAVRMLAPLLALTIVMVVAGDAACEKKTLYASEDVSVRTDEPSTSGTGDAPLLYVGGTIVDDDDFWVTYIKFPLAEFEEGEINCAKLWMMPYQHSGDYVWVSVYEVISEPGWQEDYMSYEYALGQFVVSGSPVAEVKVNTTANGFYWDVTLAAQQHEGEDFSLCIKEKNQPSAGNWAKFHSAETTTGGAQPFLQVSYSPPDDDNADATIEVTFDVGCNLECIIWPELGEEILTSIVVDNAGRGVSGIAFGLSLTPGVATSPVFENLLPGGLSVGEWDTGILLSTDQCVTDMPVAVARLTFIYMGSPGDVLIHDHPEFPRWVIDCSEPPEVDHYCVYSHGGVGKEPEPGDCPETFAEPLDQPVSWGMLKGLFR
jgi:hypothetical protein